MKVPEKLNLLETWRELRALGAKYGRRFFVAAVLWELVEDVLFPFLAWRAGVPWLIPVFLLLHFEPIVYPVFFYIFKTWDRMHGLEPWEPERLGQSTFWRASLQTLLYRLLSLAVFYIVVASSVNILLGVFAIYTVGMAVFGFVHDRIWHDSNFGIDVPTDTVRPSRVIAKVCTYRCVSIIIMGSVFFGFNGFIPAVVWEYQSIMFVLQGVTAWLWARSPIGIRPVIRSA